MKKIIYSLLILSIAVTAGGETIIMNDGSTIVGKITAQTRDTITIQTKYTTITVEKSRVKKISYKDKEGAGVFQGEEKANINLMSGETISGTVVYRDAAVIKIRVGQTIRIIKKTDVESIDFGSSSQPKGDMYRTKAPKITGLHKSITGFRGTIRALKCSPDGKYLAVGSEFGELAILSLADFSQILSINPDAGSVNAVDFARSGKLLAAGYSDYSVRVYTFDGETLREIKSLKGHTNAVQDVQFSRNGEYIVSAGFDWNINIWLHRNGTLLKKIKTGDSPINRIALLSSDRRLVSAGDDGYIKIWGFPDGRLIKSIDGHTDRIVALSVSDDGQHFATAGYDGAIRIWHINQQRSFANIKVHDDRIISTAISPGGWNMASGSFDTTIRIFNLNDVIARLNRSDSEFQVKFENVEMISKASGSVQCMTFSPDMNYLIAGGYEKTVMVWSLEK